MQVKKNTRMIIVLLKKYISENIISGSITKINKANVGRIQNMRFLRDNSRHSLEIYMQLLLSDDISCSSVMHGNIFVFT